MKQKISHKITVQQMVHPIIHGSTSSENSFTSCRLGRGLDGVQTATGHSKPSFPPPSGAGQCHATSNGTSRLMLLMIVVSLIAYLFKLKGERGEEEGGGGIIVDCPIAVHDHHISGGKGHGSPTPCLGRVGAGVATARWCQQRILCRRASHS